MEDEDFSSYIIDYDKIANRSEFLSITRLTASQYAKNPYGKVGDFFKNLQDPDLDTLCDICDNYADVVDDEGDFDNVPHFEEVLLIAEMLAAGEGVLDRTIDDVMQRTNQMLFYLAIEKLHRNGLVKVYHDNFSFGLDAGDRIVVERIPGLDFE
jgi:hypothetical protein